MPNIVLVDVGPDTGERLAVLVHERVENSLLLEVCITTLVPDARNPYPHPRVYIHASDGYELEVGRLAELCSEFGLSPVTGAKPHFPLLKDRLVLNFMGTLGGWSSSLDLARRSIIKDMARTAGENIEMLKPASLIWSAEKPVEYVEFRPPVLRADPEKASSLDLGIIQLIREWGYDVERFKIENGEPGMNFCPSSE